MQLDAPALEYLPLPHPEHEFPADGDFLPAMHWGQLVRAGFDSRPAAQVMHVVWVPALEYRPEAQFLQTQLLAHSGRLLPEPLPE